MIQQWTQRRYYDPRNNVTNITYYKCGSKGPYKNNYWSKPSTSWMKDEKGKVLVDVMDLLKEEE